MSWICDVSRMNVEGCLTSAQVTAQRAALRVIAKRCGNRQRRRGRAAEIGMHDVRQRSDEQLGRGDLARARGRIDTEARQSQSDVVRPSCRSDVSARCVLRLAAAPAIDSPRKSSRESPHQIQRGGRIGGKDGSRLLADEEDSRVFVDAKRRRRYGSTRLIVIEPADA